VSRFVSLSPAGLADDYDAKAYSDRPVVSVVEEERTIKISYIFPGFTIGEGGRPAEGQMEAFQEVGISDVGFLSESGKPLLPSFGRFVQIPPGCEYEVSVSKGEAVRFDDVLVTPAQEEATDQEGVQVEFEYDAEAYADDALYPEKVVEVDGPYYVDGYRALLVHVRPLQYIPESRCLIGYSNVDVTIRLLEAESDESDAEDSSEFLLANGSANREGFGNLLLNPGRGISDRMTIGPITGTIVLKPHGPEFLIIHAVSLKKAAERLARWKNRKGLPTEIVSIDKVGNSASQIKKYIRNRRKALFSRLRYVLLFGDVNDITTEERSGTTTDHYYFTTKDASGSGDCVLPWVSGGRIPVNSLGEAKAVVDQIIRYERRPPCDPEYYRRLTFAAYFQDDAPQDGRADRAYMKTMEGIRTHIESLGFDCERVYVSNNPNPQRYKDGTTIPADVRGAIVSDSDATDRLISETSEGQLLIGHRDHGGTTGWSHPSFNNDHLENIRSAYPSIFYSINCLTGRFDSTSSDCFAESILELDGGSPSLVAATEPSGTWRNDSLMKALFDALWPGVIATFPGTTASYAVKDNRLGDILNYAKSYLLVAHGSNSGVRDHLEIYHVIGDPTLQLWSEMPAALRVRAAIRNNALKIHVTPAPGGAMVTIWHLGKLVKRTALSSTRMTLPIGDLKLTLPPPPRPRSFLYVCVSAPGYRYRQVRVKL